MGELTPFAVPTFGGAADSQEAVQVQHVGERHPLGDVVLHLDVPVVVEAVDHGDGDRRESGAPDDEVESAQDPVLVCEADPLGGEEHADEDVVHQRDVAEAVEDVYARNAVRAREHVRAQERGHDKDPRACLHVRVRLLHEDEHDAHEHAPRHDHILPPAPLELVAHVEEAVASQVALVAEHIVLLAVPEHVLEESGDAEGVEADAQHGDGHVQPVEALPADDVGPREEEHGPVREALAHEGLEGLDAQRVVHHDHEGERVVDGVVEVLVQHGARGGAPAHEAVPDEREERERAVHERQAHLQEELPPVAPRGEHTLRAHVVHIEIDNGE
mmetsp:Transcript_42372/g.135704  ORF Transcript_42372/g.135704 Transcript_42372/m.135704 type:complete len:330 (+) Transcript_42372:3060-4049(+)